jgi:FHA domain
MAFRVKTPRAPAGSDAPPTSSIASSPAAADTSADRAGSPATPARTGPLPDEPIDDERISEFDQAGSEIITGCREYNDAGTADWELRRDVKRFFIGGSSSCAIAIPGRGLSATHCMLERRGRGMRLYDEHSTHGTWVKDAPITTADLRPGDKFTAKPVTLVAMNDSMRLHRPTLVEIVGTGWAPSPDWLMVEAYNSSHLVITGEPGCDQDRLARAIHAISPRRDQLPIEIGAIPEERAAQIALVKQASRQQAPRQRTTVVLTVQEKQTPLDETFLSMLYSTTTYGVRVIVLARRAENVRRAIGEALAGMCQHIVLRPLAYRAAEIDQLLDRVFVERQAPHLRTADLTPENQEALRTYHWPENLAELRLIGHVMTAHETFGGWRPASEAVRRAKTTLQEHFERIGLALTNHSFFKPSAQGRRGSSER